MLLPSAAATHLHNPHQTLAAQGFDRPLDSRGRTEPEQHRRFAQRFSEWSGGVDL